MKTGTQLSMTPPAVIPSGSASQPSWKTRTRTPKAAPVESRLSTIALIGITIEWNATSMSRNDRPSTNRKIRGVPSP